MNKVQLKKLIKEELEKALSERIRSGPLSGIQSASRRLANKVRLKEDMSPGAKQTATYVAGIGNAFGRSLPREALYAEEGGRELRILLEEVIKIASLLKKLDWSGGPQSARMGKEDAIDD